MAMTAAVPSSSQPSANASKRTNRESNVARFLGAGLTGFAELIMFHPVDTVAKRLMSNFGRVDSVSRLRQVIFRDAATNPSAWQRFYSLFPGLGYAAAYKILQRIYKFGGQPLVRDYLTQWHHCDEFFERRFGRQSGKALLHATAGSIIGVGEIILLPFDVLKIKRQTNPQAFKGRGIIKIFSDEGWSLYRGWQWTAARNAPGSFALFGASAATKQYVYKLEDYNAANWTQNFVSSVAGACASLTVSAPLDVVKTRIQNRNFDDPASGFKIIVQTLQREGPFAFFKGLTPKLLISSPKLVFSFWMAQTLIPYLDEKLS